MSYDEDRPLKVSRDDLYELVWSKPMLELAKDFGISDVALAKRCRRLGIPVPGRGYWARLDAGQKPYRPKLPEREARPEDHTALTVTRITSADYEPASQSTNGLANRNSDEKWLADRIAFEESETNLIRVPTPPVEWDPVIGACWEKLERGAAKVLASRKAAERYETLPLSRKRGTWDSEGALWRSIKDCGQRLYDTHKSAAFRVSLGTYERALAVMNAITFGARRRGFVSSHDEKNGRIVLAGHGTQVELRIVEQLKDEAPRKRDYGLRPFVPKSPTGRLRLYVESGRWDARHFEDTPAIPLESLLNRVFVAVYRLVVKNWEAARRAELRHQEQAAEERRREAAERTRAERARALAEERKRREELAAESERWAQAEQLRRYVRHIRSRADGALDGDSIPELTCWQEWALKVADDLDPSAKRLATRHAEPTSAEPE